MAQTLTLLIPFIIIAFWGWMFNDMLRNDSIPSAEPQGLRWPPAAKNQWTILFIILNIFTASYYYLTEFHKD